MLDIEVYKSIIIDVKEIGQTPKGDMNMKTLKRTKICSFELDMTMYNTYNAKKMLNEDNNIFYINDEYVPMADSDDYKGEPLRINHSACEEVKVVHNKTFDLYMNVVKTYEGKVYYIKL